MVLPGDQRQCRGQAPRPQGLDVILGLPPQFGQRPKKPSFPSCALRPLAPRREEPVGERHVVVGRGREYGDVPPLNGVIFTEGRTESLKVTVDVVALPG